MPGMEVFAQALARSALELLAPTATVQANRHLAHLVRGIRYQAAYRALPGTSHPALGAPRNQQHVNLYGATTFWTNGVVVFGWLVTG